MSNKTIRTASLNSRSSFKEADKSMQKTFISHLRSWFYLFLKRSDLLLLSNWRPLSLLDAKLFMKLLSNRLNPYLPHLINPYHPGFPLMAPDLWQWMVEPNPYVQPAVGHTRSAASRCMVRPRESIWLDTSWLPLTSASSLWLSRTSFLFLVFASFFFRLVFWFLAMVGLVHRPSSYEAICCHLYSSASLLSFYFARCVNRTSALASKWASYSTGAFLSNSGYWQRVPSSSKAP